MNKLEFTVDYLGAKLLAKNHGLVHGQGPARVLGDELPFGLVASADYWVIVPMMLVDGAAVPDPHSFQLATSARNATERWPVDITSCPGPLVLDVPSAR